MTESEELRPLDRGGVARALEFSARAAGDAERFSMDIERLADLLRGDLGRSFHDRRPVAGKIGERIGITLTLNGASLLLMVLLSIVSIPSFLMPPPSPVAFVTLFPVTVTRRSVIVPTLPAANGSS